MQPPANLRPGLSEAAFRRFEHIIAASIASFPSSVEVDWSTTDLRHATFTARLRDAIHSFRLYNWSTGWFQPTNVNHTSALRCIIVSNHPTAVEKVLVGPRTLAAQAPINVSLEMAKPQLGIRGVDPEFFVPDELVRATPTSAVEVQIMEVNVNSITEDEPIYQILQCYCVLVAAEVIGLPKLHIAKGTKDDYVEETLEKLTESYDVAYMSNDTHFILF